MDSTIGSLGVPRLPVSDFPVLPSDGFAYICLVPAELMFLDPKKGVLKVFQISMHKGWVSQRGVDSDVPGIDREVETGLLISGGPTHLPSGPGRNGCGVGQEGSGHTRSMCIQSALYSGKVSPGPPETLMFPNNRNPDDF